MPARDVVAVMEKLVRESRKLLSEIKCHHKGVVYDGFERSLLDFESYMPKEVGGTGNPKSDRLRRAGMVVGKRYLLHSPSRGPDSLPFEYLGGSYEDVLTNKGTKEETPLSFKLRFLDGRPPPMPEKAFYADFGLEPYTSAGTEVWHDENWVEDPVDIDKVIEEAVNVISDEGFGFEDPDLDGGTH